MKSTNKPAAWFWVVSMIALLWNLMGVAAYLFQVTMSEETVAALPEQERLLMNSVPAWATAAFAIAVWGGVLGSLLLLLRKKLATAVLVGSLAGIVVQVVHTVFISNSIDVYGPTGLVMPVMILVCAVGVVWFSRYATAKGWLV